MEGFALQAPDVSLALVLALWPLTRLRQDLKQYFVKVLRKAMYGRDVASRLFAMRGLLFVIIEGVKDAGSSITCKSSQARLSVSCLAPGDSQRA